MSSIATRHKLIKKIKDEKFDEEQLQRYVLLTQIGAKDFQAAVIDSDDNRLIFFEDYVFNEVSTQAELQEALQSLFDSHEYLLAGFWKEVKVSIKNNKFIHVPSALFIESAAADYLKFNAILDADKESVQICRNEKSDAVTIFALQNDMLQWLKKVYVNSTVNLFHQSSALIEGVLASEVNVKNQPLYVYVDRFKLHVLFVQEGKLIYYNQFLIKQFTDYVKYIMLVMKAMGLNQETSPVVLWGYIGKNSPHYQEFVKYVRNVSFGDRPTHLKFGYLFDEVQEHHFFDLYSLNLLPI
ncbi:MAG: DUF3822 family protein [Cyclobacteriaceae bacterium]|nr:DUF3822 family protein [Cyclobacteriaceae bacterium]